ncbi:MAG: T9SS type A sorting domain-containing protein [Flavobacteriales bacterium]|nr:T9SS type A sorting domain-containing protein [Flavobacteriales bacterium]
MKNLILPFVLLMSFTMTAQDNILDARTNYDSGDEVTVTGICLNGVEMGSPVRYIQDATAGIAIFPGGAGWGGFDEPQEGDEITVTGIISEYNGLFEVGPDLSSVTINSSGNPLPAPAIISAAEMDEDYEGQLVQIEDAIFDLGGSTMNGNTTYDFTANGENGTIYIRNGSVLMGDILPAAQVTVIGIASQFDSTSPYDSGYQLLPRDSEDFLLASTINIIGPVQQGAIEYNAINLLWNTDAAGTSIINWGATPALGNEIEDTGNTTAHSMSMPGLEPGTIYWAQVSSSNGVDTTYSLTLPYATRSESSGSITVYFTKSVDNSYATLEDAIALYDAIDDTIAAYINRAQHTIDIAMYNFGDLGIAGALNNAYLDGVQVRFVGQGTNANAAVDNLNAGIPVHMREDDLGSGNHNKFVVIDADYPELATVITGSMNYIDQDEFSDFNNVIIFQDQSMARGYRMEFEEMWGGTGPEPDEANSKFGADKVLNTPRKFLCGTAPVEVYFSPSDNTNQAILNTMSTTDSDLEYAIFAFTREDIANVIIDEDDLFLTSVKGIMEQTSDPSSEYQYLIDNDMDVFSHEQIDGLIHHKYCIVDATNSSSDPTVLTGSHNWSNSANTINDENTVVVHDARVANLYYQEFMARWGEVGIAEWPAMESLEAWPNPTAETLFIGCGQKHIGARLMVTDMQGNLVMQSTISREREILSTSELAPGMYFVVVVSETARASARISVIR